MARDLFFPSKDVDATVSRDSNHAESSLQCHDKVYHLSISTCRQTMRLMFARYGGHSKLDGAFITTV
jgi:hypothetical protein